MSVVDVLFVCKLIRTKRCWLCHYVCICVSVCGVRVLSVWNANNLCKVSTTEIPTTKHNIGTIIGSVILCKWFVWWTLSSCMLSGLCGALCGLQVDTPSFGFGFALIYLQISKLINNLVNFGKKFANKLFQIPLGLICMFVFVYFKWYIIILIKK